MLNIWRIHFPYHLLAAAPKVLWNVSCTPSLTQARGVMLPRRTNGCHCSFVAAVHTREGRGGVRAQGAEWSIWIPGQEESISRVCCRKVSIELLPDVWPASVCCKALYLNGIIFLDILFILQERILLHFYFIYLFIYVYIFYSFVWKYNHLQTLYFVFI